MLDEATSSLSENMESVVYALLKKVKNWNNNNFFYFEFSLFFFIEIVQ